MHTTEVATLLGISPNTVRTWTWREFRSYFSPGAQGGDGSTREFTELDVQVMSHIATLTRKNVPRETIHAELTRLQANDWQDLPPIHAAPAKTLGMPVVSAEAAQKELDSERRALLREVATLQMQAERLERQLIDEREARREDSSKLQSEIAALREQLGRAEERAQSVRDRTLVELYENGRLKPPLE